MAKKTSEADRVNKRIKERDKATLGKIVDLADDVATSRVQGQRHRARHPARARAPTPSGTRSAASSRWATPRPRASCST